MKLKKITVDWSTETADTISYILHDCGSMGEVFDDYNDIKSVLDEKRWDYADASLFTPKSGCSVSGFFTMETDIDTVAKRVNDLRNETYADFGAVKITVSEIDSVEWENEWKKYYVPFNIGKLIVVPEWIDHKPACGDVAVKLNPGLAFGTGTHETTSMCIDLMQRLSVRDKTVLDFGCGSGILGICAYALGAKHVLFADTDPQAVDATRYNCKLNGISDPEILCRDVRDIKEPADIVVANITADVLQEVEPVIKSALKRGGYAVISGIISDKLPYVKQTYERDFTLMELQSKNEWSAIIYKL